MRIVWGVTLALTTVCLAVAGLTAEDAPADGPVTISFTTAGSHSFTVPAGITSIHVVAVGAKGGGAGPNPGGQGGVATADVVVTPGEALTAVVGGEGGGAGSPGTRDGSNGGGKSVEGGGGGGASDLRTSAADLTSRLGGRRGWRRCDRVFGDHRRSGRAGRIRGV